MTGMIGPQDSLASGLAARSPPRDLCAGPNAGPGTLDGTNTWLIGAPGSASFTVIDPGPDDVAHWQVVAAGSNLGAQNRTHPADHGHLDHSAGARMFARLRVRSSNALDPTHQYGSEGVVGGDVLELSGVEIRVVATPGHSSDSLSFYLPQDDSLLTGDTVLGRGTTVVAYPDGTLVEYLDSLHRLRELIAESDLTMILPGHGPTLDQPAGSSTTTSRIGTSASNRCALLSTNSADMDCRFQDLAQRVVEAVYADVPKSVTGRWHYSGVRAQIGIPATHG